MANKKLKAEINVMSIFAFHVNGLSINYYFVDVVENYYIKSLNINLFII